MYEKYQAFPIELFFYSPLHIFRNDSCNDMSNTWKYMRIDFH